MLSLLLFVLGCSAVSQNGTVYFDKSTGSYKIAIGVVDPSGCAWGTFADTLNTTGWGVLELRSGPGIPPVCTDRQQMYAAGFLEGFVTAPRIFQAWHNSGGEARVFPELDEFTMTQRAWAQSNAEAKAATDPFWRHITLLYEQLDGMTAGYGDAAVALNLRPLNSLEFTLYNNLVDIPLVLQHLHPDARPDWANMSQKAFHRLQSATLHCSALVKVTANFSELFFAHDTWSGYGFMNRIFKTYYFGLLDSSVVGKGLVMSSYPGQISSQDDYYLSTSGLAVVETTNAIYNNTELDMIHPQTLSFWLRVRSALALSTNGKQWTEYAMRNWSGCYPDQWLVVDYKLFTPGQPLQPNTLWVMEEIPSHCEAADMTTFLARGHWPSYNVPFFPSIYANSGYPDIVSARGTSESYDLAPRANIFRRDADTVSDLNSFKYMMRYNQYQTDPLSLGDPCNAIMCRDDLSSDPWPFGAIDTKITSSTLFKQLQTHALSGPTTQGQPPFVWSPIDVPHMGLPEVWNFDWQVMQPTLF